MQWFSQGGLIQPPQADGGAGAEPPVGWWLNGLYGLFDDEGDGEENKFVCVCVFLQHAQDQNLCSSSKVRTFLVEDILTDPHNFKGLFEG